MKTILLVALAALTPYAITSVEELKTKLKAAVDKQRRRRLINWTLWGWKIRVSVRDKDVDNVLAEIDRMDADDVTSFIEELMERLA